MVQQKDITGIPFNGGKFIERYGVGFRDFSISGNTLFYPDALPNPASVILEGDDPLGFDIDIPVKYRKTTDATPITLTYTPPTTSTGRLTVVVTATNGTSVKVWNLWVQVKRGAGNVSIVGAVVNPIATQGDAGASTWTAAVTVSGANVVLTLTGQAATTIHWLVEFGGRVFNP